MTESTPSATRTGPAIQGSNTPWSRQRIAAGLSISELAAKSGVARSVVGLIDQGRMVPSPAEAAALLRVLPAETAA